MKADHENRGQGPGGTGPETGKAVTLASVVRSKGRGKMEQVIRLPAVVAFAPRGERHEQVEPNITARPRAAINADPNGTAGQLAADAVQTVRPNPDPRPTTFR